MSQESTSNVSSLSSGAIKSRLDTISKYYTLILEYVDIEKVWPYADKHFTVGDSKRQTMKELLTVTTEKPESLLYDDIMKALKETYPDFYNQIKSGASPTCSVSAEYPKKEDTVDFEANNNVKSLNETKREDYIHMVYERYGKELNDVDFVKEFLHNLPWETKLCDAELRELSETLLPSSRQKLNESNVDPVNDPGRAATSKSNLGRPNMTENTIKSSLSKPFKQMGSFFKNLWKKKNVQPSRNKKVTDKTTRNEMTGTKEQFDEEPNIGDFTVGDSHEQPTEGYFQTSYGTSSPSQELFHILKRNINSELYDRFVIYLNDKKPSIYEDIFVANSSLNYNRGIKRVYKYGRVSEDRKVSDRSGVMSESGTDTNSSLKEVRGRKRDNKTVT